MITCGIIFFALVASECKFAYVDVKTSGSKSAGSVWQNTPLQKAITGKKAHLPDIMATSSGLKLPPVIVGDEAFSLSPNVMKLYTGQELAPLQRIFNYRYALSLSSRALPKASLCILFQALQGTSSCRKCFRHLGTPVPVSFDDGGFQTRKAKEIGASSLCLAQDAEGGTV
ncbi:hypothetical protein HPB48_003007 [Haemaphysalis longicornis]|uniref:DDE Tnp4 domain-containing protein n=1 Tax=Haemaphysalis longicornis TaxID=44386 RepID=A0A9J6FFJ5_HAELO|nr:hypothetical protein HPB48_003007 [Haemaphysalis longicornis]